MRRLTALLVVAVVAAALSGVAGAQSTPHLATLDASVVASAERLGNRGVLDLVVSLDRVADRGLAGRLTRLGLWSRTFEHLPVAAVRVPVARLGDVQRLSGVTGVYLNERLDYYLADTARLMNTKGAWEDLGLTGKGVTVAILDTGIDFNHPDLAPAMRANVKFLGYGAPLPVLPLEGVTNSDTSSGHGTHVAGIVAGRGTQSAGEFKGMGHGADLIGLGAGDALYIFTVLEGFNWIIEHRDEYDIRAVNNSWGTEFKPFDPNEPIQLATKAVSDAGVAVLFAMGNSSDEMTMNPYATAPWVIPVAAGSKTGGVTDFSSGGIEADTMGQAFGSADVKGDPRGGLSMGLYHPAVTGTGDNVVSTRAILTEIGLSSLPTDLTTMPPDQALYYTPLSGTSMATPAVTGVVALLVEANRALTPAQLRQVLQITAKPIPNVPFYRQGYGYVDASAAAVLAKSLAGRSAREIREALDARQAERDRRVLAGIPRPERTFAFTDPAFTGPGSVERPVEVTPGTGRLKVVSSGPSTTLINATTWDIEVLDADGDPVGTQPAVSGSSSGTAVLDLDLRHLSPDPGEAEDLYDGLAWGQWTVRVSSLTSTALPVSLPVVDDFSAKRTISIVVATFGGPTGDCAGAFVPQGTTTMRLQSDASAVGPDPVAPDHSYVGTVPDGSLGNRQPARRLSGTFGALTTEIAGAEPRFVSEPLAAPLTLGGPVKLEAWMIGNGPLVQGLLLGSVLDVAEDGTPAAVVSFPEVGANAGLAAPERTEAVAELTKPYTVAAGHRVGLSMGVTFIGTAANTLYFDSDAFPSGLTLTTGKVVDSSCVPGGASAGGQAAPSGAGASPTGHAGAPAAAAVPVSSGGTTAGEGATAGVVDPAGGQAPTEAPAAAPAPEAPAPEAPAPDEQAPLVPGLPALVDPAVLPLARLPVGGEVVEQLGTFIGVPVPSTRPGWPARLVP